MMDTLYNYPPGVTQETLDYNSPDGVDTPPWTALRRSAAKRAGGATYEADCPPGKQPLDSQRCEDCRGWGYDDDEDGRHGCGSCAGQGWVRPEDMCDYCTAVGAIVEHDGRLVCEACGCDPTTEPR